MDPLKAFDIEFIKLKDGEHVLDWNIDNSFFEAFKSSLTTKAIQLHLELIKSTNMFTLDFSIQGSVDVACDRCLTDIQLPISAQQQVVVKITDFPKENEDDLIYLTPHDYKINIAQHLFDFIALSLPIKKTCDSAGQICDSAVTSKITSTIDVDVPESDLVDEDFDDNEIED